VATFDEEIGTGKKESSSEGEGKEREEHECE
jgi:hypothetical protein